METSEYDIVAQESRNDSQHNFTIVTITRAIEEFVRLYFHCHTNSL